MLFRAIIVALVLGTALSARAGKRVQAIPQVAANPMWQGRSSLTQGFLCDCCVVGVEDAQNAISQNLDTITGLLNRTSALCEYCPVADQCRSYIQNDILLEIGDFLAMSPNDLCTQAGLCDENATLPGMVMNNLNGNVARDRVIKQMLSRARVMQQKMIRLILGPDFLCTTCLDILATSRELLLDNDTQYEIMDFLMPLCDYMPPEYQTQCTDIVQSLPELMTMLANEVLTDATCTELGFCQAETATEVPDVDIFSQLGLDRVIPSIMNGRNPFQFPSGSSNWQNPFRNPFGSNSRPEQNPRPGQNPYGIPSRPGQNRPGQNPYGLPSRPGQTKPGQNPFQFPSQSRPQQPESPIGKWPTNSRPSKAQPQKPKTTTAPVEKQIPDFNLEDIFGKNTGILDNLPSLPQMPDFQLPRLPINIPGSRRRGSGRRGGGRHHGRRQRSVAEEFKIAETFLPKVPDVIHEYLPDPIPDAGIIITGQEPVADENCEVCKMAVLAVSTWLQENAPELEKKISNMVTPLCQVFPSPMKEDCVSDVSEFLQTFIQTLVSQLKPELCTLLGVCSTIEEVDIVPTIDMGVEPTTWWPRIP